MTGVLGRNPRAGVQANCAVILVERAAKWRNGKGATILSGSGPRRPKPVSEAGVGSRLTGQAYPCTKEAQDPQVANRCSLAAAAAASAR
jgi:hypothetical protein